MTADQVANTAEAGQSRAILEFCQVSYEAESVEGIYDAALTALERAIGVQRSSILLFDRHGVMRFGAWRGLSETYRKAVEGHSPWSADAKDPEPILVPDVALDPALAALGPVFDAERIAALAFVPLVHAGRLLGKFMLYYEALHPFTHDEVRVASAVAQLVAGAVDRKRNEVDLRRNREHLALALEASAMGTWEWDLASGEVIWSPTLERIHGLEPGTFPGTFEAFQREILAEDLPGVLAAVRRATQNGAAYQVTYRLRRPDGTLRWIDTQGIVVRGDTGAPVRMVGVCTDVTQRRAGEAERARLLDAERAARREAETSAARLDTLQRVTAELSRAVALDDVVDVVLGTAVHELGGQTGSLCLRNGDELVIEHAVGYPRDVTEHWGRFPISADLPASEAVRTGRAVFISSPEERDRRYPVFATTPLVPDTAYAIVPLADHDPTGCLVVGFAEPREFSAQDEDFFFVLASRCGAALERARLFEEREHARAAVAFLAEASAVLVSSLDYERTLRQLAELAVPRLADWCGVYLTREPGEIEPVAITHVDPDRADLVRRLLQRFPVRPSDAVGVADVIRTGQPQIYPAIADDVLVATAHNDEHLELLRSVGLGAGIAVPLQARGRVFGALSLANDRGRPLHSDDVLLVEELAARAGTVIDNARLFAERTYVAQTLQRSLLPGRLPEFDRLALAARYLPGAPDVAAGGDWYDVLALDGHRVAIVVGDVVGRGAAAAAVMGQLRTALATALLHGDSAAAALEHLDRMAARVPGALASTAVVTILDLVTGQLCWSRAGHPPPLLVAHDDVRYLTDGAGGPLGISGRPPYPQASTRIEAGACLLLYTDGLIERRGQVIDEGLDHLAFTAAQLRAQPPTTLLDGLLARALPDTGPADDIALVAARYLPAPLHQRLLADPAQLSGVRRAVRGWVQAGALPAALGEDLQITLGEAAANAVEHAYVGTAMGEFTYLVTRCGDGAIEVQVRDFGRWRRERANNFVRGRGLMIIRELGVDVVVESSPAGTDVRFRVPAPLPDPGPEMGTPASVGQPQPDAAPAVPAELRVHQETAGGRRLEFRGELDLDSATRLNGPLLDQLHAPGPVILDLRAVDYLSSAGVGLLIDAVQRAAVHDLPVQLQLTPDSLAARVLALTGLEHTVPLVTDATQSTVR
ncbi:MAG TPA: SpoIIE family protein phosphatase [Pseudonocardiaceae bacterium]|jgi:anti-anti-sigma factor|nr:SpoIIE family protein phosphatase [Pseudonocardiaceae bacterium]